VYVYGTVVLPVPTVYTGDIDIVEVVGNVSDPIAE
jgi:hypothetical protein